MAHVIATDIDPVAVVTAHQNMEQNRVRDKVELRVLNGWPEDEVVEPKNIPTKTAGDAFCTARVVFGEEIMEVFGGVVADGR